MKAAACKSAHGKCQMLGPGPLTELVHAHSLCSCSLQLEKVVVKPAQVFTASFGGKPDVEVGAVGSQNNAVLRRRRWAQREGADLSTLPRPEG